MAAAPASTPGGAAPSSAQACTGPASGCASALPVAAPLLDSPALAAPWRTWKRFHWESCRNNSWLHPWAQGTRAQGRIGGKATLARGLDRCAWVCHGNLNLTCARVHNTNQSGAAHSQRLITLHFRFASVTGEPTQPLDSAEGLVFMVPSRAGCCCVMCVMCVMCVVCCCVLRVMCVMHDAGECGALWCVWCSSPLTCPLRLGSWRHLSWL